MPRKRKSEQARIGTARSNQSFRRQQGNRERPSLLIVCEGEATEPIYFNALRADLKLSVVEVEIVGEGCAPVTLVQRAVDRTERRKREAAKARKKHEQHAPPFDEVWCIFDTERLDENPSFYEAVRTARQYNIQTGVSNPAFEYWYLLHFDETSRPFSNAYELIKALEKYIPGYAKNQNVYGIIGEYTDAAIDRADTIVRSHKEWNPDDNFPNPSTYVYKLVKKLKSMASPT